MSTLPVADFVNRDGEFDVDYYVQYMRYRAKSQEAYAESLQELTDQRYGSPEA